MIIIKKFLSFFLSYNPRIFFFLFCLYDIQETLLYILQVLSPKKKKKNNGPPKELKIEKLWDVFKVSDELRKRRPRANPFDQKL